MKVGLIDVDGHNFPNLALMKLSAYHKALGNSVEMYQPWLSGHVDKAYMAKVFTYSRDYQYNVDADEIINGGTGYGMFKDLPNEIDSMFPDYSLYPQYENAIGFLTRGCIRNCPWCIVPKKEGAIRPYSTWQEIKRKDSRNIVFLDNNVLAHEHGIAQIESMVGQDIRIDFNQGMDARLVTPEVAKILSRVNWIRFVRFSCDTEQAIDSVLQAARNCIEAGISKSRLWCYMLVKEIPDAIHRFDVLTEAGFDCFAQPYRTYDATEPPRIQRDFARWVNGRFYKTCKWNEYKYNTEHKEQDGGAE